ncbi:MAG: NAD(P)-dependent oxidoreductase [Gemmatimonadota bacterium]|jgi:3-hydroxyisobutyrate dehydrogenase|nr:NAD(P)-dependent oxidoreductase [Gemmatimonadota bacterium]
MPSIAFLGTGLLGGAFVEAALGRGETVTVWNRTAAKAVPLASRGARVAATPADAVRGVSRVHLVLQDDDSVEAVIAALRPGLGRDVPILDHTTTQPARTAVRASRLAAEGVRYLHCPVFIGPAMARQAQGTIMVSGPRAWFDAVQPALASQAARVEYLGERPDAAAVYKLCGNTLIVGISGTVADMLAVARGGGLSPDDALRLFDFFDPSRIIGVRGRNMAAADFTPSFELTMARKDVRLMLETAATQPLAVLPGLAARMDALIADGEGARDLAVLGRDSVR